MLVQGRSTANDGDAIFDQASQLRASQSLSGRRNGNLQIGGMSFDIRVQANVRIGRHQFMSSTGGLAGTWGLLSGENSLPFPRQSVNHNIVSWTDGFTVNDGPFRSLDDPENASFLKVMSIMVSIPLKKKAQETEN